MHDHAASALHLDLDTDNGDALLPIREIARRTGVNPVTLRAWERRYGLIKPQRTAKGHRLYSEEQLERIQAILAWLARGVAVSQVRRLLDEPNAAPSDDHDEGESDWQQARQSLAQAVADLAERRLDDTFNRLVAIYPPRTLCERLLLPLLAELRLRWQGRFGAEVERAFLYSWLRSKLGARLYHSNRQQSGAPLLLVNLGEPLQPETWLLAWTLASNDLPLEVFDWSPPMAELSLALEHLAPRALLLSAPHKLAAEQRRGLPRLLEQSQIPVLLCGAAASIHADELTALEKLTLVPEALDVTRQLRTLP